jgi:hypothetical protein
MPATDRMKANKQIPPSRTESKAPNFFSPTNPISNRVKSSHAKKKIRTQGVTDRANRRGVDLHHHRTKSQDQPDGGKKKMATLIGKTGAFYT